jgi:hypothetical protein
MKLLPASSLHWRSRHPPYGRREVDLVENEAIDKQDPWTRLYEDTFVNGADR